MKILHNRIVRAFLLLMLVSAIIHIILLSVFSIKNWNFRDFNFFNIIDLDLFFPHIGQGWLSHLVSIIIMTVIFFVMYIFFAKHKQHKE